MSLSSLNQYRVMWIFVIYDLPAATKTEQKALTLFRKLLMEDGFTMFQFSVYIRHCASFDNAEVHIKRVQHFLPSVGKVSILCLTDKQFGDMKVFYGKKQKAPDAPGVQLELF